MKSKKIMKKLMAGLLSACMVASSGVSSADLLKVSAADTEVKAEAGNPLRLWYNKPVSGGGLILDGGGFGTSNEDNRWQQLSLPIGNSMMGANVYGEVGTERLTFNQKTLWNGGPSTSRPNYNGGNKTTYNGAPMSEAYQKVEDLFLAGKDSEASNACNALTGDSSGYGAYQSWGDIYLKFSGMPAATPADYSRGLDLTTGIADVDFSADGTKYHREYFMNHEDNVLAMKLTAEGSGKLNLNVSFPIDNGETSQEAGILSSKLGKTVDYVTTNDTIITKGTMQDNQMKLCSVLKVANTDGNVGANADKKSLDVSNASEVVIYISADTDYENKYPSYRTGETLDQLVSSVSSVVDTAAAKTYTEIKNNHLKDYQGIFSRLDLDLGQTVSAKPTDELLAAYKNGSASQAERRQLEVLLYQYGRFLTIESSREGDLPSNLQGVWQNRVGDANRVPWGSDYHMNVNLQMNYWPTYSANMAECAIPLIDYIDSLREPGRVTAETYYGIKSEEGEANGFTAHTQNTPFGWTCPGWDFSWGWSPAAVPWILQNCWEYYEYTGDKQFMEERIYPMLKEEATLYDQILVDSKQSITLSDGTKSTRLVSVPTYSPEQGPRTLGNAYEQELIWQLYEDVITAAETLGVDADKVTKWKATQERLSPIEVGDSGQIKEWYNETTLGSIGSKGHRHMSHLLGLFPGDLISVDNDEYMDAAIVSLKDRGDESTGWGMGQRINSWARTGDGEHAYTLVKTLFKGGIYPNLFDTHSPFQIDGNFGYTSGVNEMLMQSNMGYINILPAIPSDWRNGSVDGIVARGNFELGIDWTDSRATKVEVLSKNGGDCVVQYDGISEAKVVDKSGKAVSYQVIGRDKISFATEEGASYTITDFAVLPAGPSGVKAVYTGAAGVELSWTAVAGDGVTYNVYRKDGTDYVKVGTDLTETSYVDTTELTSVSAVRYKITFTKAGQESDYSDAAAPQDLSQTGYVDDTSDRVVYSGTSWGTWPNAAHYGGSIHFAEPVTANDSVSLRFVGTGIKVVAPKNKGYGSMAVWIDDQNTGDIISFAADSDLKQQIVYVKEGLPNGLHTIKLVGIEKKVELDAFIVLGQSKTAAFTSDQELTAGELPEEIRCYEGDVITLPGAGTMKVKGYAFKGWKNGVKTYGAGTTFQVKKDDETFTAVWEESMGDLIASGTLTAKADSEEPNSGTTGDGPASFAIDGNTASLWHTNYSGGVTPNIAQDKNNSFTITMDSVRNVTGLEYVTRAAKNGRILGYKILYSTTLDGDDFVAAPGGTGTWADDAEKKTVKFTTPVNARRIQIRATKTAGGSAAEENKFISAVEFYLYETGDTVVDTTGITLNKSELSIENGTSATLQASILPSTASDKNITWESSEPAVATVDSGVVTAVSEGTTTITVTSVTYPNIKASCLVTVTRQTAETHPVTDITISAVQTEVKEGATITLTASVIPENATNQGLEWTSSNPAVATAAGGVVTGITAGEAEITVSSAENAAIKKTCKVTVKKNENPGEKIEVERVTLSEKSASMLTESTKTLTHTILPADATNQNVVWTSSNEAVATVKDGVITAVSPGKADITVTSTDNSAKFDTCQVTVNARIIPVDSIQIPEDQKNVTLKVTDTKQITYTIAPDNATNQNIKWSSDNERVATVANGIITAVSEGTATVKVESVENTAIFAEVKVTVEKKAPEVIKVESVVIRPELTLTEGENYKLAAEVKPENATDKSVTWAIDDANLNNQVAEVNSLTGEVKALKPGQTTIKATAKDGSGISASCVLTVKQKETAVTGITVSPAESTIREGAVLTLTAAVTPENATNKKVTWKSSDASVASVTENEQNQGVVKAMNAGITEITATSQDGKTVGKSVITVTKAEQPKPNVYTVKFDAAKGSVSPSSIKVEENKAYGTLPTPSRSGYEFLGWYNGSTKVSASTLCKGNVTLTAKWKYVKPVKVTGLKAVGQSTTSVKLTWNKVSGATMYRIFRYNAQTKKWRRIRTTTNTQYTDKNKANGTTYQYRVAAFRGDVMGDYSTTLKASTTPGKPVISVSKSGKTLKVKWNKMSAYKFNVYVKAGNKKYEREASLTSGKTSFSLAKMKKGSYKVKVRAYTMQGKFKIFGSYSKEVKITF